MKKHDEGYVLVYVTVVLTLFCLIAGSILAGALKNLNNQQTSITQMQDKYVAQGMIEQVVSQLNSFVFVEGKKVGETDVDCILVEDPYVTLSATYGTVTITCKVNKGTGACESYNVSSAVTEPSETEVTTE